MQENFDVVIIGGGASGLMCANFLDKNKKVLIIEKATLGKKLLVTGNGRCNFTNKNIDVLKYNQPEVEKYFKQFDNNETIKYFKTLGVESFSDDEGRIYPLSNSAKDIQSALIKNLGHIQNLKDEVVSVKKKLLFEIQTLGGEKILAKNVVMACGNLQISSILRDFDLKFEEIKPALVGFEVKKEFDKSLFGLREDVIVRAEASDKKFEERGVVQFRKNGISGIVIFNLSAFLQKNGACPFDVSLEFLPNISKEELKKIFEFRKFNCKGLLVKDALFGLFKPELGKFLLTKAKIKNLDRKFYEMSETETYQIINAIKNLKFTCSNTFDDPEIWSGGVSLKNLNGLECPDVKGLYFCGETTNVFGPCGGYNLQWAFSSGRFVSQLINKL